MTSQEARQILLLYRPHTADDNDPQMRAAIEFAKADPELARWFANHCLLQETLRHKFREIKIPPQLRDQILARHKIAPLPAWYRQSSFLAAAAAFILFMGLAIGWLATRQPDTFSQYRDRMVSTALREYRMDVVTNDMAQLRRFMATGGAPADYEVGPGLERLQLTGGGLIRWQDKPVAMICFNRGDNQMLFLFVLKRDAIKAVPSETPQISTVHELTTVSWSRGDKTYVLAGPRENDFVKKYL